MNNDSEKTDNMMNNDPEKTDKTWKEIIVYLVYSTIHLVSRLSLLLLGPVLFLLIPILLCIALLWASISVWSPELLDYEVFNSWNKWISDNAILIIFVITPVLIWFLAREFKNDIKNSLSNIIAKIVKVVQGRWLLKMNTKKSLSVTWKCYMANIWLLAKEMFIESKKLFVAVLLLFVVTLCSYTTKKFIDDILGTNKLRSSVMAIKAKADSIAISDFNMWRDGVTNTLDDIKKNIVPPKPSISYPFEKGTQFPVFYLSQGDLDSKKGICPTDSNLVEWLTLFKQAISKCPENKRVKLQIRAFASTAPVTKKGHPAFEKTTSDTFNYLIANERAEALIYFLTLDDPKSYTLGKCKDALSDRLIGKRARSDSIWIGQGFTMTYNPWDSHIQMTDAKLVKDGSLDERRRDLEFLNRSVQIIIEEGGCLTK